MTFTQKHWIDNATYEQLLAKWRFAPAGDPLLAGEPGDYFTRVMYMQREAMSPEQHTRASKAVGWCTARR